MTAYVFPSVAQVLEIHQVLIDAYGGTQGIRDIGLLESALGNAQQPYHTDIFSCAAAMMRSLGQNHPFVDGNKRVAYFVTDTFLDANGYVIHCSDEEARDFILGLFDAGNFEKNALEQWLREKARPV